jgi:hypothetical protein
MSAAVVKVTICPPYTRGDCFSAHQFISERQPVSARFAAHDAWTSTGLSFGDYQRAQTHSIKLFASRRFATPTWATNDGMLRKVIGEYLVHRACGRKLWKDASPTDDIGKIRWAENLLRTRIPRLERSVDSLCDEYVALRHSDEDPARLRELAALIGNLDSQIIFNRAPARIVASCVYGYYRQGLQSVGVAESLALQPPAVRQLLRRIWLAAGRCGFEERRRIARCSRKQEALDNQKSEVSEKQREP